MIQVTPCRPCCKREFFTVTKSQIFINLSRTATPTDSNQSLFSALHLDVWRRCARVKCQAGQSFGCIPSVGRHVTMICPPGTRCFHPLRIGSGGFDAKDLLQLSFYGLICFHLASQKRFKSPWSHSLLKLERKELLESWNEMNFWQIRIRNDVK